jgi:hypothetical protein
MLRNAPSRRLGGSLLTSFQRVVPLCAKSCTHCYSLYGSNGILFVYHRPRAPGVFGSETIIGSGLRVTGTVGVVEYKSELPAYPSD